MLSLFLWVSLMAQLESLRKATFKAGNSGGLVNIIKYYPIMTIAEMMIWGERDCTMVTMSTQPGCELSVTQPGMFSPELSP